MSAQNSYNEYYGKNVIASVILVQRSSDRVHRQRKILQSPPSDQTTLIKMKQQTRSIIFRADASPMIGTGHIRRCLVLANFLSQEGHSCVFLTRQLPKDLADLVRESGHDVVFIGKTRSPQSGNASTDWLNTTESQDASDCIDFLGTRFPDLIVVDHYGLSAAWEKQLKDLGISVVVIDDLANRPHDCALLIDQNLGRSAHHYAGLVPSDCQLMIGPQYALIGPQFQRLREVSLGNRKNRKVNQLLISMGGVDAVNATGQILRILEHQTLDAAMSGSVILSASSPHLKDVEKLVESSSGAFRLFKDVRNMHEFMSEADIAIGAGGSTSWERCCLGLPTITITVADNQLEAAVALDGLGASINLGQLTDTRWKNDLTSTITMLKKDQETRLEMIQRCTDICDGLGTARVASALVSCLESQA